MGEAKHKITIRATRARAGVDAIKDGDEVEVSDHTGQSVKLTVGKPFETDDSDVAAWVAEKAAYKVGNDHVVIVTEYAEGPWAVGLREGAEEQAGRALTEAEKGAYAEAASTKKSASSTSSSK
jgi:hypothetical protein